MQREGEGDAKGERGDAKREREGCKGIGGCKREKSEREISRRTALQCKTVLAFSMTDLCPRPGGVEERRRRRGAENGHLPWDGSGMQKEQCSGGHRVQMLFFCIAPFTCEIKHTYSRLHVCCSSSSNTGLPSAARVGSSPRVAAESRSCSTDTMMMVMMAAAVARSPFRGIILMQKRGGRGPPDLLHLGGAARPPPDPLQPARSHPPLLQYLRNNNKCKADVCKPASNKRDTSKEGGGDF